MVSDSFSWKEKVVTILNLFLTDFVAFLFPSSSSSLIIHHFQDSSCFLHLCLIEFIFNLCFLLFFLSFSVHFLHCVHFLFLLEFVKDFTLFLLCFSWFYIHMAPRANQQQNPDYDSAFFFSSERISFFSHRFPNLMDPIMMRGIIPWSVL